jgi:uncharacterized membrane protein YgcG
MDTNFWFLISLSVSLVCVAVLILHYRAKRRLNTANKIKLAPHLSTVGAVGPYTFPNRRINPPGYVRDEDDGLVSTLTTAMLVDNLLNSSDNRNTQTDDAPAFVGGGGQFSGAGASGSWDANGSPVVDSSPQIEDNADRNDYSSSDTNDYSSSDSSSDSSSSSD